MNSLSSYSDALTHILDFFHLLLGNPAEQDGYLTLTAIHPTDDHQPRPSRHVALGAHFYHQLERDLTALLQINQLGWGAYFGVALRKQHLGRHRRGGKADLLRLPALIVDIDKPLDRALPELKKLPPPTITIASGSGLHAYYKLHKPVVDFDAADATIRSINTLVSGDLSMNCSTSFRLPGTLNTKPNRHAVCTIYDAQPDQRYDLTDFSQLTPCHVAPRVSPNNSGRINPELIQAVLDILYHSYAAAPRSANSKWHKALCPLGHTRDFPGSHFFFDSEKGAANCFGRHGALGMKDLIDLFDLDPQAYGGFYAPAAATPANDRY